MSVAWNECAGQLAAGDVALVRGSWVLSPLGPPNMYIGGREQFEINTHTGVEIDTRAFHFWNDSAGQLAGGSVASVWRDWVRSPLGPRLFVGSFSGLKAFPCARVSKLNQQISIKIKFLEEC